MIPKEFDYHKATSVQEAISLLQEHGEDAKLLAGGHSLLPVMKLRLAAPTRRSRIRRGTGSTGSRPRPGAPTCGYPAQTGRSGPGFCCCRAGGRWALR